MASPDLFSAIAQLGVSLPTRGEIYDIAEWNLACAANLPGSETIDASAILARIDEMAVHVDHEIKRNYHRFLRNPRRNGGSQPRYCALMLITVVQQDFGVRYNPHRVRDPDFRHSGDLFIHGMLGGDGGTCASMPVLYTAIGARLGWPIKLAHARGHVFCRWDDPQGRHPFGRDRFNIEGASLGGHIFDDDYYRTWPEPIPESDVERGVYLKSLDPAEELASFLSLRGHCLFDNGRIGDARNVYQMCRVLAPRDRTTKPSICTVKRFATACLKRRRCEITSALTFNSPLGSSRGRRFEKWPRECGLPRVHTGKRRSERNVNDWKQSGNGSAARQCLAAWGRTVERIESSPISEVFLLFTFLKRTSAGAPFLRRR